MSREEVARDIAIVLGVIRLPIQAERRCRSPHEPDKQWQMALRSSSSALSGKVLWWFRPVMVPAGTGRAHSPF